MAKPGYERGSLAPESVLLTSALTKLSWLITMSKGPSTNCPQKEKVPNLLEMESQLHSISSLGIWRYWIWPSNRELGWSTWSQTFFGGGGAGSRRWLVRCPRSNQISQFNHGADASPGPGFTKKPAPNSGLGITTGHQRKWGPYTPHPVAPDPFLLLQPQVHYLSSHV